MHVLFTDFVQPDLELEAALLRDAVALRDEFGLAGKVALEASGGVDLDTVRAIAESGVERISVGSITHSAAALDLSLERC